jgi:CspA family cold shock protein
VEFFRAPARYCSAPNILTPERNMDYGTIKWYSHEIGFGFITPHDGRKDILLHESAVLEDEAPHLSEGRLVAYQMDGGRCAAVTLQ